MALSPPAAPRRPHELTHHGHTRIDPWYWLRDDDRTDAEVLALLEAENDFVADALGHTEELQAELFREIKARIKETDLSVPYRKGAFWFYSRTEEGRQYPFLCRTATAPPAALDPTTPVPGEEVMLDLNALAGPGPLRDPDQRRRRGELQADGCLERCPGPGALGRAGRAPARREARGGVGLRRAPGPLRAPRRRAPHRRHAERRWARARAGDARGGVQHRPGHQRGVRDDGAAVRLHLAGHAEHGVRGGPVHRRAGAPEAGRGAGRPRSRGVRDGSHVGHRARRHRGADLVRAPP